MKLCFDIEISAERLDNFRRALTRLRWPSSIYGTFAFNYETPFTFQRTLSQRQQAIRRTQKSLSSIANITKKKGSIGLQNSAKRQHKYAVTEDSSTRKYKSVNNGSVKGGLSPDDHVNINEVQVLPDFEHLGDSPLCKDYERLGLGSLRSESTSHWRISLANLHYNLCRRYV